jgi:hypothetical protein
MSALGQKQTFRCVAVMSALPPKADIRRRGLDVRFVPKAEVGGIIRSRHRRARRAQVARRFQVIWPS